MDDEWAQRVAQQVYYTCCEHDWRRGLYEEGTDLTRYRRQIHGGENTPYEKRMQCSSGRPVPVKLTHENITSVDDNAWCTPMSVDKTKPEPAGSTRGPLFINLHEAGCKRLQGDQDGHKGSESGEEEVFNPDDEELRKPSIDITEHNIHDFPLIDKIFLHVYREEANCSCNGRLLGVRATRLLQPFVLF